MSNPARVVPVSPSTSSCTGQPRMEVANGVAEIPGGTEFNARISRERWRAVGHQAVREGSISRGKLPLVTRTSLHDLGVRVYRQETPIGDVFAALVTVGDRCFELLATAAKWHWESLFDQLTPVRCVISGPVVDGVDHNSAPLPPHWVVHLEAVDNGNDSVTARIPLGARDLLEFGSGEARRNRHHRTVEATKADARSRRSAGGSGDSGLPCPGPSPTN